MTVMERLQNRLDNPAGTSRAKALIVEILQAKHAELTASERSGLADDKARWKKIGDGGHLDDWLAYGPGLLIRRRLAMKLTNTNRPEGKTYSEMFNLLMMTDGIDTKRDKTGTAFTAVLWIYDAPERVDILRELRDAMTPGERSRLNSPITARQRIEKILKARGSGTEAKHKDSPVARKNARIVELTREIADLQTKLTNAYIDGFDLKRDKADDIATAIVNNVGEQKAKAIASGIIAWFKQKQNKPAG